MNKKTTLIAAIIALIILSIFAWQLTLIVLGVIALVYAINLIKNDYAYPDAYDQRRRGNHSNDINLDFLKQDKEIKDNSRFEERNKNMSKSINRNKKKKHHTNNYENRNDRPNRSYDEREIREDRPKSQYNDYPKKKKSSNKYDEPLISPALKKVLIFLGIIFIIMIIAIFILALKQNNTPFEVEQEKDPLVMTQEERDAQKAKKEKEKEDREKAKEEKQKEEEEKKKAEEEAKEKEEEKNNNDEEIKTDTKVDEKSPVSADVYQD